MFRRLNPWPAFSDLFSCLLIGTFAGLMLQSRLGVEQDALNNEVDIMVGQIDKELANTTLASKKYKCGKDICIDLPVHFDLNSDVVARDDERSVLREACPKLKGKWEVLKNRDCLELVIEGHSDDQPALGIRSERERGLFNWNLSSARASSVMYELNQCGIKQPDFSVVPVGLADSRRVCKDGDPSPECRQQNRRTTLRFRVNTQLLEDKTKGQTGDQTVAR